MSVGLAESLRLMFGNALLVRQEEGAEIDLQVGRTVTKAPKYMRTQLWLGVLQRFPGLGNKAAQQYMSLLRKPVPELTADDIAKDVGRTFPSIPRFTTEAGKLSLMRVLRAYAVYDPEVNYCQGMNFLAALLLIWMPSEAQAFGGLVVLMQERGLRELYKEDMTTLQAQLWQIGKLLPPRLAAHLENNSVLPVLYASSWLLTAFSADFPLFWSSRVMDVILTDCYIEPMMKVVIGIIRTCGPALMRSNDMERMVQYIKVGVPRWRHATLQEVLTDSLAMEWTPEQSALLRQLEGVETVVEAVKRVQRTSQEVVPRPVQADSATHVNGHLVATAVAPVHTRSTSLSWASRLSAPVSLGPAAPSTPHCPKPPATAAAEAASIPEEGEGSAALTARAASGTPPQAPASHLLDDPPVSAFQSAAEEAEASETEGGPGSRRHADVATEPEVGPVRCEPLGPAFVRGSSLAGHSSHSSFGEFVDFTGGTGGLGALLTRMSARSELQPEAIGRDPAEAEPSAPADDMGLERRRLSDEQAGSQPIEQPIETSSLPVWDTGFGTDRSQEAVGTTDLGNTVSVRHDRQAHCPGEELRDGFAARHSSSAFSFGSFDGEAGAQQPGDPAPTRAPAAVDTDAGSLQQPLGLTASQSQYAPETSWNLLDEDVVPGNLPRELSDSGFVLLDTPQSSPWSSEVWLNEAQDPKQQPLRPLRSQVSDARSVDSRLEEELSNFTINFAHQESRKKPMLPPK